MIIIHPNYISTVDYSGGKHRRERGQRSSTLEPHCCKNPRKSVRLQVLLRGDSVVLRRQNGSLSCQNNHEEELLTPVQQQVLSFVLEHALHEAVF